jgi:iron complex transport system substrate-binding protein
MTLIPHMRFVVAALWLLAGALVSNAGRAENALPRVATLDHCADQYALALADRSQIVGLSHHAVEDYSFFQSRALGLPRTTGSIEELLYARPNIVIRYWGGSARMWIYLKQAGIKVASAKTGVQSNDVFENVVTFAKAFGRQEAGRKFIADYQARLAKLRTQGSGKLRAIYVTAGGTTAGAGASGDEIIRLAGMRNAVAEMGLKGWRTLPLETLIMDPPDVIIAAFFDSTSVHHSDWGLLRHPVVKKMFKDIPTIFVPGRLLACRAFMFVDAAEYVVDKLEQINAQRKANGNPS